MKSGVATLLLVTGCARANPAFDAESEAGTSRPGESSDTRPGSGDDATPTSKSTGEPHGTSGGAMETSAASMTGPITSDTGSVDTGAAEEDTGSKACAAQADASIEIEVVSLAASIKADCQVPLDTNYGPLVIADGAITVSPCGACPCPEDPQPVTVALTGPVDFPVLPPCGSLFVWGEHGASGACEWVGVAVLPNNQSLPLWIASSSLNIHESLLAGATVGLQPLEACPAANCDGAGPHALVFSEDIITVDEPPKLMQLDFGTTLDFIVDNLMSYVDDECGTHVAWTATAP